jgi:hypothetical protein
VVYERADLLDARHGDAWRLTARRFRPSGRVVIYQAVPVSVVQRVL